jgi:hypothetical protein
MQGGCMPGDLTHIAGMHNLVATANQPCPACTCSAATCSMCAMSTCTGSWVAAGSHGCASAGPGDMGLMAFGQAGNGLSTERALLAVFKCNC